MIPFRLLEFDREGEAEGDDAGGDARELDFLGKWGELEGDATFSNLAARSWTEDVDEEVDIVGLFSVSFEGFLACPDVPDDVLVLLVVYDELFRVADQSLNRWSIVFLRVSDISMYMTRF
jgi:hypothetical protein